MSIITTKAYGAYAMIYTAMAGGAISSITAQQAAMQVAEQAKENMSTIEHITLYAAGYGFILSAVIGTLGLSLQFYKVVFVDKKFKKKRKNNNN